MSKKMTVDEAFRLLDLPSTASNEEIKSSFRRLSKDAHPDLHRGDEATFKNLTEARDQALAYAKIRHSVVPGGSEIVRQIARQAMLAYSGPTATERADQINRRASRQWNWVKWSSWGFAGVAGFLGVVRDIGDLPILSTEAASHVDALVAPLALLFAFVGLVLHLGISMKEHRIESYLEIISSKRECAAELAATMSFIDFKVVDEEQLVSAFKRQSRAGAMKAPVGSFLSTHEIASLLMSRSVELGLLTPDEEDEISPETEQRYIVNFKPGSFKPKETIEHPPAEPMPIRESVSLALGSLVIVALAAYGARYLFYYQEGLWGKIGGTLLGLLTLAGTLGLAGLIIFEVIPAGLRSRRNRTRLMP